MSQAIEEHAECSEFLANPQSSPSDVPGSCRDAADQTRDAIDDLDVPAGCEDIHEAWLAALDAAEDGDGQEFTSIINSPDFATATSECGGF